MRARWVGVTARCVGRLRETGVVYDDLPEDVIAAHLAVVVPNEVPTDPSESPRGRKPSGEES